MTDRNLKGRFFNISGFTQFELDDIIYRTKQVKETLRQTRQRKRQEQKTLNKWKFEFPKRIFERNKVVRSAFPTKSKPQKTTEQIQRGFDVADKWRQENEELARDNTA